MDKLKKIPGLDVWLDPKLLSYVEVDVREDTDAFFEVFIKFDVGSSNNCLYFTNRKEFEEVKKFFMDLI